MKCVPFLSVCALLACAEHTSHPPSVAPTRRARVSAQPALVPPVRVATQPSRWTIRAFPQASISVALPENGIDLKPRDLGQTQALLALGVQVNGQRGPSYALIVYPVSHPLVGATLEQRLYMLPHLLSELGPQSSRRPVDLDGLHGVEFVTNTDSLVQRARVFATATHVIALIVKSFDPSHTTDRDAQLFFDSLQWYDEAS